MPWRYIVPWYKTDPLYSFVAFIVINEGKWTGSTKVATHGWYGAQAALNHNSSCDPIMCPEKTCQWLPSLPQFLKRSCVALCLLKEASKFEQGGALKQLLRSCWSHTNCLLREHKVLEHVLRCLSSVQSYINHWHQDIHKKRSLSLQALEHWRLWDVS